MSARNTRVPWEISVPDSIKEKWVLYSKPLHNPDANVFRVLVSEDDNVIPPVEDRLVCKI